MVQMSLPSPFIVGCDLAGTVAEVGPGVTRFEPGDRVWGSNQGLLGRQGTFAEYCAVDECWLYPTPDVVARDHLHHGRTTPPLPPFTKIVSALLQFRRRATTVRGARLMPTNALPGRMFIRNAIGRRIQPAFVHGAILGEGALPAQQSLIAAPDTVARLEAGDSGTDLSHVPARSQPTMNGEGNDI